MTLNGIQRQIYHIMCYFQCNCDVLFDDSIYEVLEMLTLNYLNS